MWDWDDFSRRNLARSEAPNGFNHKLGSWSLSDWMTALAGEVGEAANVIKKLNRIRDKTRGNERTLTHEEKVSTMDLHHKLSDELADVVCYLDLLAQRAGIDLPRAIERKFARVSREIGYTDDDPK